MLDLYYNFTCICGHQRDNRPGHVQLAFNSNRVSDLGSVIKPQPASNLSLATPLCEVICEKGADLWAGSRLRPATADWEAFTFGTLPLQAWRRRAVAETFFLLSWSAFTFRSWSITCMQAAVMHVITLCVVLSDFRLPGKDDPQGLREWNTCILKPSLKPSTIPHLLEWLAEGYYQVGEIGRHIKEVSKVPLKHFGYTLPCGGPRSQ